MSHDATAPVLSTMSHPSTQSRLRTRAIVFSLLLAIAGIVIGGWFFGSKDTPNDTYNWAPPAGLDPKRAFGYLEKICDFGPRPCPLTLCDAFNMVQPRVRANIEA